MFAWLRNKKLKPTAEAVSRVRGILQGRTSGEADAAGADADALDADPLPPHPLLSLLPPGTLKRLLADGAIGEYKKGTVVFRAGEPCDAIFLILSGRCETRRAGHGDDDLAEISGPGDLLGARALLNREPHCSSALVTTHAVLLRIPAQEVTGLFATDASFAGRFTQAVTVGSDSPRERRMHVRRIVAMLPMTERLDADAVARHLAGSLHRLADQRVLIVRLGAPGAGAHDSRPLNTASANGEFFFTRNVHVGDGFDEVHLTACAETRDVSAVAPMLSHCGRHYDYVVLHVAHDTPVNVSLEALVQADLGFVLLQSGMENLYQFQLLIRELGDRGTGAFAHVKPILFAEEAIAAPEMNMTLRTLGHPVHSIVRGFPLRGVASAPDRRFDLAMNRLAREIARCRIGLALSSGSAKGLAHIGVIQVLEENGIEIDCIAGASMGAYVGAVWAFGLDGDRLEKFARETEGKWGFIRLLDPMFFPRRGFLRTHKAAARLRHHIDDAQFSQLIRPLRVVATHLDTLERVVFSSGNVAAAVEASIAIPGVCVPVTLDGETYIDGGIADPLPVDVLAEMGIERIIAVNVIPPPERIRYWLDARRELNGRERPRKRFGRFLDRQLNLGASGNIIDTMMRAINGSQTRVAEASARDADIVLRPLSGEAVWHDFSDPKAHIALGRNVAEAQLPELKSLVQSTPNESDIPLAL